MEKILIVDGHNLLFQMFYGMPSRIIGKNGKPIQGVLGFVGALIKIIKMITPDYLVVLFDSEKENERTEILSDYKANRQDYSLVVDEENPFSQLQDIYNCLDYMGIKHTEATEYEADDVIASYSFKYGENYNIYISSFDSDFFQLITDNVKVLRYRGDKTIICDEKYFNEKFGISPDKYAEFKSLTGDIADNIKGVEKVGPKTAAYLLNTYDTLAGIIENAENITKPSIKNSILKNKDIIHINHSLIKLTDKAKLPYDLSEIKYQYNGITSTEILMKLGYK